MTKQVFFIHWNEAELKEKIASLRKAGYKVGFHFSQDSVAKLKDNLPDALIVCLDRLPSHGQAYAEWLWEAKKRQYIPIVFCGGKEEKVQGTKAKFPNAVFCSNEHLLETLARLS